MAGTLTQGVKMFLGIGEYATPANLVYADPYFLNQLKAQFGKEKVEKKIKELQNNA